MNPSAPADATAPASIAVGAPPTFAAHTPMMQQYVLPEAVG